MRRRMWVLLLTLVAMATGVRAQAGWVEPGAVWRDTAGNVIQAHGGGVLKVGAEWWWFGEDRTVPTTQNGLDAEKRYVSCYRSRDLVHWAFAGGGVRVSVGSVDGLCRKFGNVGGASGRYGS